MLKKPILFIIVFSIIIQLVCGCGNNSAESLTTDDTVDYLSYIGSWVADGCSMEIESKNSKVLTVSFYFPNHDGTRIASVEHQILISSIVDNKVSSAFKDSWGTTGITNITFEKDNIIYEIKDSVNDGGLWSVDDGVYHFVRGESPTEEPIKETPAPQYDISKASGILAQMGMTEDEFRNSCSRTGFYNTSGAIRYADIIDYPSNYTNMHCFDEVDIFEKTVSAEGKPLYISRNDYTCIAITDFRDDVYAPTVSIGERVAAWMIFKNVQTINGIDYACFNLISASRWSPYENKRDY